MIMSGRRLDREADADGCGDWPDTRYISRAPDASTEVAHRAFLHFRDAGRHAHDDQAGQRASCAETMPSVGLEHDLDDARSRRLTPSFIGPD